jgi:hypothetical protein
MRLATVVLLLFFAGSLGAGCRKQAAPGVSAPPLGIALPDVAAEMGLHYRYSPGGTSPLNIVQVTGAGAAFLDYDRDGWLDVLCVGYPHPALFHNERGKRFTDVTRTAGLGGPEGRWYGCATGDYDNDGFPDLYLTGYNRTALFHNNGNGTFTDVTERAGARVEGWTTSAAFADVNRDGFLDLYVARYVEFRPGMPEFLDSRGVQLTMGPKAYNPQHGVLLLNQGGRRFRDATREAGLDAGSGKGLGVAFADADNDGDDDLFIANDEQPQDFFQNDGKGHFRNVAMDNGTAFTAEGGRQGGMGVDFGDYDGDGALDLFVANFMDEPKSLYRNVGRGLFEPAGNRAGVAQSTRPWVAFGSKFLDLNGDGLLDLMILNGHVQDRVQKVDPGNSYPQKPQLFLNQGQGRFREISGAVGPDFQKPMVGRALAVGDFDNDGDLDALAADLEGPPRLFRNDGGREQGSWLTLELEGTKSNRSAIGARVELRTGTARQVREVRADGSYLAAHDLRVHFGLGAAKQVDAIDIRWPSGARQSLKDVPANQMLHVREGASDRLSP